MSQTARTTLTLILLLFPAAGLAAQQEPAAVDIAAETSAAEVAAAETATGTPAQAADTLTTPPPAATEPMRGSQEIRNDFSSVLRQHPPELATILSLDPTLLSNEAFLTGYPELARFVAEHPEVRRNPRYYLAGSLPRPESSALDDLLEAMAIFATFLLIAVALAWTIRTIVEQKRWSRLSRTQAEVHNKILDRFGSSEELLEYVRTPAGARFLESAPIPLHAERRAQSAPQSAPLTRVLWSIQIGVVVAVASLGMLLVSIPFDGEGARALFVFGAIGFCLGAGFVASAAVSLFLSRRLGLWELPGSGATAPPARLDAEAME